MGHDKHHKEIKVGTFDVVMGLIVFVGLWYVTSIVAGPEGFGFLKGKLDAIHSQEMLVSGCLIIFLWATLSPIVIKPYLEALYEREAKTSGMLTANSDLKREVEKLKAELSAEIKTARLEGVKKRDEKINAAKKQANEIVEAGKKIADDEWKVFEKELSSLKNGLMGSIDNEVNALSGEVIKKILPTEISSKYLH